MTIYDLQGPMCAGDHAFPDLSNGTMPFDRPFASGQYKSDDAPKVISIKLADLSFILI